MTTNYNNQDLIDFIYAAPSPFHAVEQMLQRLQAAGFTLLHEHQAWQLQIGGKYCVIRNGSSLIAFIYGKHNMQEHGIRMVGAHTDSPCLRLKPEADLYRHGYWQVGVEVYGGALLAPWFDRPLGLAGRVSYLDAQGLLQHCLVNVDHAIGMVPSLAIHLDREVNQNRSINAQNELPVVLGMLDHNTTRPSIKAYLKEVIHQTNSAAQVDQILDYELSFYDLDKGLLYGAEQAFIASARLDNLLSCYIGLHAMLAGDDSQSCLLVCTDHEEVGSASAVGAQGSMLDDFLHRLLPDHESFVRTVQQSMMISADNAHAIHPNFAERHDGNHGPRINAGPVIKVNANQRYASNSQTQALYRAICQRENIPVQSFVVRSDMACGSTIGPIAATKLGIKTLDIGVPTLAMHSIKETAGSHDCAHLLRSLSAFFAMANV
jgi:aspartyl aminopeptidase